MRNVFLWMGILAMSLLYGCATNNQPGEGDNGVETTPLNREGALPRTAINDPASPLAKRLVFFDFDKSDIKPEFQDLLEAHGRYLAAYPDVKVRLEGHTDERGSREYNLALAEQRAKAVRQVLLLHGALAANLEVVSFGEEVPMAVGHDEAAWAQNRRVELVYEAR
ncbi:MAG TPA: peptidoglycan-associated lipoprotein Pal [Gammaproteobacteria bacterium]|nr:peptidoglycan-associated lipoprotein Pal [Gammaproteobacteria bacterium]